MDADLGAEFFPFLRSENPRKKIHNFPLDNVCRIGYTYKVSFDFSSACAHFGTGRRNVYLLLFMKGASP
jgi:hypothetical protein